MGIWKTITIWYQSRMEYNKNTVHHYSAAGDFGWLSCGWIDLVGVSDTDCDWDSGVGKRKMKAKSNMI